MFYSQLLLSKTGALGIVWMAAHCHKRLRKCDILNTNISNSVDKILDGEVREVTHRILAFLLLGIVRIYSKKAEYLFNDCHEMLNRLSSVQTRKSKQAGIGVSQTHYHSISLPKRFELDAFDLELLENQDVVGGNVRAHGKDKLADRLRKDASTSGLLLKENSHISRAHSMAYTPPRDVFGHSHMGQNFLVGPSSNKKISLAGVEVLRGTRFYLGDHRDPNLLDEVEDEEMHKEQAEMNFQGPTNDMESDSDVGPPNYRRHSLPSLEIVCGTWFALEDRLEPMVLDEAEKEQLNGRPSNHEEPIQDMEIDFINHQSSKEGDSVAILEVQGSGTSLEQLPYVKTLNEGEKVQGHEKQPDKEHGVEEEHVEHLNTEFNFQEGEHPASVDKAKAVDAGDKVPEVITPESGKRQRQEELCVSIATPNSKLPGGAGTSEVAFVQTPGRKERSRILKKRKALLDLTSMVVPNNVFKNWIGDATDLMRKRREVAHTRLGAWRADKGAHFPLCFLEPSIPGVSVDIQYNKSFVAPTKTVELSSEEGCVNSPVTYGAQEHIPVARSPVREKSPRRTLDVQSLGIEESPKQAPIAPGTPSAAHLDQLRCHEFGAVADSDIMEPATSYESVGKGPSLSEPLGFDVLLGEETSSFEEDSFKQGDTFSTRTRLAGSFLSGKFLDKRRRKEEEVLSLSQLLVGKTKKESARFFYETLVLKTHDCIDVQQEAAYHDIVLHETPKLRQVLNS